MSEPTFNIDAAEAARSVHNWTRFAALMTVTAGSVLLIATVIAAGVFAAKYPQYRGLIAGVGTIYAISALAMLCFSFLLVRYGQKLELAAKLRAPGPLVEALPYENGIWSIVAGYVAVTVLSVVISIASPTTRPFVPTGEVVSPAPRVQPIEVEDPEAFVFALNAFSGGFAVVGLVLLISALRPVPSPHRGEG